jgi:O-methyltransferase involved in polyketide biosynthesis
MSDDSTRISPTSWYTGYVWFKHGLAPKALVQRGGPAMFWLLQPIMWAAAPFVGGVTLEGMLLQRHRILDRLLEDAIEAGEVSQVLEIAAGFTGRGLRFTTRHPELRYIETDLPHQIARKRAVVEGIASPNLEFRELDIFAEGESSLEAAFASLDPGRGVAVITEGLINYFDTPTVLGLWARIAGALSGFPNGRYLADLRLRDMRTSFFAVRFFMTALGAFARGKVHAHFADEAAAIEAATGAGFQGMTLHTPASWRDRLDVPVGRKGDILKVVEART